MGRHIDVVATTISGSIKDWGKVKRIVPLFTEQGETDVSVYALDSHKEARRKTAELVRAGSTIIISAGGSGTFNAVVEGCFDSGRPLRDIRIGFLRKGSADLIGKVLGMPDEIEAAIKVFTEAIRADRTVPCDVLLMTDRSKTSPPRRFVGYGGAEIFGRIPYFTENRFIKYYKGVLSQLFGDLGPFFVGTNLSVMEKQIKSIFDSKRHWTITVDDRPAAEGFFQAMIIVNGDLGPDLPFARSEPLGSGHFHLFTLRDLGRLKLYRQLKHAWDASILDDPQKWGFESFVVEKQLLLECADERPFELNADGSTVRCQSAADVTICDRIYLLSS